MFLVIIDIRKILKETKRWQKEDKIYEIYFILKHLFFIRLIYVDRDTIYKIERPLVKTKKKIKGSLFVPNCTFLKKKLHFIKNLKKHTHLEHCFSILLK